MIRNVLISSIITLLALVSVSCTSFKSKNYVGKRQFISESELTKDSIWQVGDNVFCVRIVDTNTLAASSMKWDEKSKQHALSKYELVLSTLGEYAFLNVKDGEQYTILRLIGASGDSFVLMTVDPEKVEADIAAGRIKAHKDNSDFIADCSKEELDKYVLDNIKTLFSVDGVTVVKLISGQIKSKDK
ncbi:MAG: hypothetical protein PF692_04855 [Kiritimatiellae bacterium]|jgi:hypothetical protein|nr:hypothetical protein [Kiritimatiellia bacterium]